MGFMLMNDTTHSPVASVKGTARKWRNTLRSGYKHSWPSAKRRKSAIYSTGLILSSLLGTVSYIALSVNRLSPSAGIKFNLLQSRKTNGQKTRNLWPFAFPTSSRENLPVEMVYIVQCINNGGLRLFTS